MFPPPTHISERNQERVSALAKVSPAESDPRSVSPIPPKSTPKAYAIVNQPPVAARRPSNAPPKIISHKELLNRTQGVQCYDAVPVNEPEDAKAGLENFIPMLEEYLKRTLKIDSRSAHTMNICCFFPSVHFFSDEHPAYNTRHLVHKRLRLGHLLPQNLQVHGLEQDLS